MDSKLTVDLIEVLEEDMSCEAGLLKNRIEWLELKKRLALIPSAPIDMMYQMVARFNQDIIGVSIPDAPTMLNFKRGEFRLGLQREELHELEEAISDGDFEGTVDGFLDVMYVAFGGLVEMGIPVLAAFQEVHEANMQKQRGSYIKRPHSKGHDAIKPKGWKPPNLTPYLLLTKTQIQVASKITGTTVVDGEEMIDIDVPAPKILVIGHARHGKDTVSEMLRDKYDMSFTSSSLFCAERVVMPYLAEREDPQFEYINAQACFDDRHNHRALWYEAIRDFNRPDASALGRAIFEEHDVYCGLRSKTELNALKNQGTVDLIIWVDRSEHAPVEGADSCTVEPWMADFVLDNNGSLEDLAFNLDQLMGTVL